MLKNVEIAERLGYLDLHEGMLVPLQQAKKLPTTRSSTSSPARRARRARRSRSSRRAPTRGSRFRRATRSCSRRASSRATSAPSRASSARSTNAAPNIIDEKRRLIHVSGHASQEDIRIMTEAVRPKFVVPVHGEYRMLYRHKEFLKNHCDFPEKNIILIENGDVLELEADSARVVAQARDRPHLHRRFGLRGDRRRRSSKSAASSPTTASSRPSSPSTRSRASSKASPRSSHAACSGLDGNGDSAALLSEMRKVVTATVDGRLARRAPRLVHPQRARPRSISNASSRSRPAHAPSSCPWSCKSEMQ